MKKHFTRLLAVVLLLASAQFASCSWFAKEHDHEYGPWSLSTAPTEDASGVAEHTCQLEGCGKVTRVQVPPLKDAYIWTPIETVEPTHETSGKRVYTSVYGTVEIVLPQQPHTFGDWSMTVPATETEPGTAVRTCPCGSVEETVVPVLTDTSVWTLTVTQPQGNAPGRRTYTSVWGTVEYTFYAESPDGE